LTRRPLTEDDLLDEAERLLDGSRVGLDKITAADLLAEARRAKMTTRGRSRSALAELARP
jgi:hypothetical protein